MLYEWTGSRIFEGTRVNIRRFVLEFRTISAAERRRGCSASSGVGVVLDFWGAPGVVVLKAAAVETRNPGHAEKWRDVLEFRTFSAAERWQCLQPRLQIPGCIGFLWSSKHLPKFPKLRGSPGGRIPKIRPGVGVVVDARQARGRRWR